MSGGAGGGEQRSSWGRKRTSHIRSALDGRFELKELLGRGGMGAVWRAHDPQGGRDLALKLLATRPEDGRALERFRREAELTARLQHPGIVRVHAAGETGDGRPWIAYELVEGRTLRDALPDLPRQRRVELVRDAARALGHAHARGVVHRDVKAENLLLDGEGHLRVADFGLAVAADLERLTRSGAFLGTLGHMAPEQLQGRVTGPACDVWSLGVLLYEALVDAAPFEGPTLVETAARVQAANPRPPRRLDRTVPAGLDAICRRALERDPARRYPDADALADDLERWLAGERPRAQSGLPRPPGKLVLLALLGLLGPLPLLVGPERADPEELARGSRELLRETRELLGAERPLAEEGARLDQLSTRALELRARGGSGPDLRAAESRLLALRGLSSLAHGDVATASSALGQVGDDPLRDTGAEHALRGWLGLARDGDPTRAAEDLRRAREQGVLLQEVRLAHALALVRGDQLDAAAAQAALRDLERARARPVPPGPDALELKVGALLALGRLAEAQAAVGPDAPFRVRWLLALAGARAAIEEERPGEAHELLRAALTAARARGEVGHRPPDGPIEARLAAHCALRAELLLGEQRGERFLAGTFDRVLGLLGVTQLLRPESRPAQVHMRRLLEEGLKPTPGRRSDGRQLAALADLLPDDLAVQEAIALHGGRMGGLEKGRVLPVMRRAFAMARDPDQREALGVNLARALVHQEQLEECIELCERLWREPWTPDARVAILCARAEAWGKRGVWDAAWADLERARAVEPSAAAKSPTLWAKVLRGLGRLDEALERAALSLAAEAETGDVESSSRDEALVLTWELGRAAGPGSARLEEALVGFLETHGAWAGWWVRLALVRLEREATTDAAVALRSAAAVTDRKPRNLPFAPLDLRDLAEQIEARGAALLPRLRAMVEELERLRGRNAGP